MDTFPKIISLFYSEFNNVYGPRIEYQVPTGGVALDFEAISEYVIPKSSLYHRLVSISTENHVVMGFAYIYVVILSLSQMQNILEMPYCSTFVLCLTNLHRSVVMNML
jgi:hypothetical protein